MNEMSRTLRFYYPHPRFPSVSVTGGKCSLNCEHCGGHYLAHMPDVSSPERLRNYAVDLAERGGTGMLVSGGSTPSGSVPLTGFTATMRWIKENTGLILNVHTGLLDQKMAEELASTGADFFSLDLVGSTETIKNVYNLNATTEDYESSLIYLKDAGVNVVPHITIGLDHGILKGEDRALETAVKTDSEVIVINALIPTAGTAMENTPPPSPETILKYLERALCSGRQISLGCMRPRDRKPDLEKAAIALGVPRISLPSNSTVAWAQENGYEIMKIDACCAIPVSLESRALRPS